VNKCVKVIVAAVVLFGSLAGCATKQTPAPGSFQPVQVNPSVHAKKVETFVVVLDTASSMSNTFQEGLKIERAKEIIARLNRVIPQTDYRAGLMAFTAGSCLSCEDAMVLYGMGPYRRAEFDAGLAGFKSGREINRFGPMGDAVGASRVILKGGLAGQVALIMVSSAENIFHGRAIITAQKLKGILGDRLCIFPILVDQDVGSRQVAEELAKLGGCGFAVNADDIASPKAMADYVTRVFLAPAPAVVSIGAAPAPTVLDADGDGVPDSRDKCPNSPKGVRVDADGCWVPQGVYFDTDKAVIKETAVLDEALAVLKANPSVSGEVHGHTDNTGSADHNQKLSEERAKAVRDYLIQRGIAPERIRAEGFGETRSTASNDTAAGRALNRRAELHPGRN
jgi:OOP family OmpA-OmpF porin